MRSVTFLLVCLAGVSSGFQILSASTSASTRTSPLFAVGIGQKYEPKWKKKSTLADEIGDVDLASKGLKGTIPVVFKQGNVTRTTMALAGQPLSDVAIQAGQFIKYGCKKGECGTCQCMMNGKWVRPCTDKVPADLLPGQQLVLQVKVIKNKSKSSGKFYSFKSFIMGFWNNLLGMVGFVKWRKASKKNWLERQEYEELIRVKTLEKRAARLERERLAQLSSFKP
jgi:ferredoxin